MLRKLYTLIKPILPIVTLQFTALVILSLLRLVTYFVVHSQFKGEFGFSDAIGAFIRGVWFDAVTSCYVMILPAALMYGAAVAGRLPRWLSFAIRLWIFLLLGAVLFVSVANIAYFTYFFQTINASIYQWFDNTAATAVSMVLHDSGYWLYIALAIICLVIWGIIVFKLKMPRFSPINPIGLHIGVALLGVLVIGIYALGIRGRTGKQPIRVSQAYYCHNPVLNQLGINPAFNLYMTTRDMLKSENKRLHLVDEDQALAFARQALSRNLDNSEEPLLREVVADSANYAGRNVVLIFLESFSSEFAFKGDTPRLDSIFSSGLFFENTYSSGNHTNNGIYSTLYSYPSVLFRNVLKNTSVSAMEGLPTILEDNGYRNLFFMTHEKQYDNLQAYLTTNGFHEIYGKEDYPASAVAGPFGVSDQYLFEYAANRMGELSKEGGPFFSVLLTIANHPPYSLAKGYKGKYGDPERDAIPYEDMAVGEFFDRIKDTDWYRNTIFVIFGDHGKLLNKADSELPNSFNHIPMVFYGEGIPAQKFDQFALQMDIAPTLIPMLGISYQQKDFGVNLLKEERPYAYYTSDKYLAIRDKERLYIYSPSEKIEHRYYIDASGTPCKTQDNDQQFEKMKEYMFMMFQCSEVLTQRNEQRSLESRN